MVQYMNKSLNNRVVIEAKVELGLLILWQGFHEIRPLQWVTKCISLNKVSQTVHK